MAGSEDGGGQVNVQAYRDRFSAKDVMLELSYWGFVSGADQPLRSSSKGPTVQRRVLFMDGESAGETRTVDVGADGVFAGRFVKTWRNGERVHYEVVYRVEEVRLGFGDTVFLGFGVVDERPSWPQTVQDAIDFVERQTVEYRRRADMRREWEWQRLERERQRREEREKAAAEAESHAKFVAVRRRQKRAQEARRRFQPPHID